MEQVNQQPPGGQQAFPQTNQQEKQLMTILGVQGLSYQNYSVVELKIVLQIIKHAQKAILGYVIPYHVTPQTFSNFTVEQRVASTSILPISLSFWRRVKKRSITCPNTSPLPCTTVALQAKLRKVQK
jgi:DNA integrity scanning protein DisA with diadenylate cyclase activity